MTTKLPTDGRPLIRDTNLAEAIERELAPLSGKALERAQAAIRKVRSTGVSAPFDALVTAYRKAITEAVERER